MRNKPSVTIEQFNIFFKKFDVNGHNMIEKSEMARFVRQYIQGLAALNMSDSDQAGSSQHAKLNNMPLDQ